MLLADILVGDVLVRLTTSSDLAEEARAQAMLGTASLILEVVAAVLIVTIVVRITTWQERTPRGVTTGPRTGS